MASLTEKLKFALLSASLAGGFILFPSLLPAADDVRVGFFSFDGYHHLDEKGNRSGYGYDFLTLMKRYADIRFEYAGYESSWQECLQMLLDGRIDMLTSAHKTAERLKQFDFSMPIGSNSIRITVRFDDNRHIAGDFSTYEGMRIGLIEGSSVNSKVMEYARSNGFTFNPVYLHHAGEIHAAFEKGMIDAAATSSLRKTIHEKVLSEFNTEHFYAIVKKGNTKLLRQINEAILQMDIAEGNWKNTLFERNYAANNKELLFTDAEKRFIEQHSKGGKRIIVAMDNRWAPFSLKGKDGRFTGILPEFMDLISKMTGMDYAACQYDGSVFDPEHLNSAKADIYLGYGLDFNAAERSGLVLSPVIIKETAALLSRKDSAQIRSVGLSDIHPRLNSLLQLPSGLEVRHFETTGKLCDAIIKGEVDGGYVYSYEAMHFANKDTSGQLAYAAHPETEIELRAALPENGSHVLLGIVSKCIRLMNKSDMDAVITNNLTIGTSDLTLRDWIRLHSSTAMSVIFSMLALAGMLLVTLLRHKEKAKANALLKEALNRAEESAAELECQLEENRMLNGKLQEKQASLEGLVAEQEAQIEEIETLNNQLTENQSRLEEASAEQEAQLEEINTLNGVLSENKTILERQLAVIGATSRRYFCAYTFDLVKNTFHEVFALPNMHAVLGSEGDAAVPLDLAWRHLVLPEDQEMMRRFHDMNLWNDYLKDRDIYSIEYRGVTSAWSRASLFAAKRENGIVTGVVYVAETIHEQKETENKLAARIRQIQDLNSELEARQVQLEEASAEQEAQIEEITALNERLSAGNRQILELNRNIHENLDIIANAGYGIWRITIKPGGRNTMTADATLQNILGVAGMNLSPEELYRYYHDRLHEDVSEIEADDYSNMGDGSLRVRILKYNHPVKGTIILNAGGTSYGARGGGIEISGYCGDITEQKRKLNELNEKLEAACKRAEAANNAKTAFLFSMSHDIRTPMNAIIGFRNLLEKHQENPEKRADYLNKIKYSSTILLSIINNVLEMARIEKGAVEVNEAPLDAKQFNDTLYSIFQEMMRVKGIAFTQQVVVRNPYVYCDQTKLREIFINILSNAYKYTNPGGSVNMLLEEIPSGREGYARFRTTVTDSGIGMSEEYLPHIFEEFSRENSATDNKIEGTGLGMPIVKRLVDLLGGTIEVASRKGEGSTFIVTLSHRIADGGGLTYPSDETISQDMFKGRRILLAEDNKLNAEIAWEILGEAGFIVDIAEDGDICCRKLMAAEDGFYDLILMDIQMPNMNGYEAARSIRRMPPPKGRIPILAMTANAFEEDRQEALRSGMNGHLAKPINVTELMRTLAGILGRHVQEFH